MRRIYDSAFTAVAAKSAFLRGLLLRNQLVGAFVLRTTRLWDRRAVRTVSLVLMVSLLVTSSPFASQTVAGKAKQWQAGVTAWANNNSFYTKRYRGFAFGFESYQNLATVVASKLGWGVSSAKAPGSYGPVEPMTAPPLVLGPPTNLVVTLSSNTTINLAWTAPAGTVDHYVVERSQSQFGPFSTIASPNSASHSDNTVAGGSAYLYRVRAVDGSGTPSSPSTMAVGTAISFTDDPLVVGVTVVKAQHLAELRQAVNAVRNLAGLSAASWTDTTLSGVTIKALHIQELRDRLGEALTALSVSAPSYTDPTLATGANGTLVKKAHIAELRQTASRDSSSSTGALVSGNDLATARLDPMNSTGGGGENPLSRNYNWSVPLVNLPGRAGLNLGLSLSYNSLVWTKSGSYISFDDDRGFPSAGFRLGFPIIQPLYFNAEVNKNAFLLITPDGSRTELRQVGTSALYEAADSSHLLLDTGVNPRVLKTTDGMQMSYVLKGSDYQCTEIKDRNGNFITVTYTSFNRIHTVVDTVNRTIKFNYDATDNTLTSISQTWTGPTEHLWASFNYNLTEFQTNFVNVTNIGPPNGSILKLLSHVTLNNNSRFDFDYTYWGQIWKINNSAADGHVLNYHAYNLPGNWLTALDDCPRFTARYDWAENWNRGGSDGPARLPAGAEQETTTSTWTVPASASWNLPDGTPQTGMLAQVTQPADGTYAKVYFAGVAGTSTGWSRSLVSMVETYGKTDPSQGGTAIKQRSSVTSWTQDNTGVSYPLNPRSTETNVYDFSASGQIQNRARTTMAYETVTVGDGTSCKLPVDITEFQANATTPLRRTHIVNNNSSPYLNRRIIGLTSERSLYQVDPNTLAETLMAKVGFSYDDTSLQAAGTIVQHDNLSYTTTYVSGRANLNTVSRFDATGVLAPTTSTMKYDIAGSLVATTDPGGNTTSIEYAENFSDGNNSRNTLAYPTKVTAPGSASFASTSKYNFDFGAVTRAQTPAPAGQAVGSITNYTYDSRARLVKTAIEFEGNADYSHARTVYPDSQNRIDTYTTIKEGAAEAHSFQIMDGHGRSIASASDHPGSTGGFSGRLVLVDKLGRAIKTSNLTETYASGTPTQWVAAGDDQNAGWLYTSQTYDWKGRTLTTTNTDGTVKEASYSGCGCAGGQVVSILDEGTLDNGVAKRRQQNIYSDILGRTVKTELLNWQGGSVYSSAVTNYNARDQVTSTRLYQGSEASGVYHEAWITYDGYGRQQSRHVPEQKVDSNIIGSTDHTTWTYNADDTVLAVTDARGVTATLGYNSRHLLTSVIYPATQNLPANVPSAPNVTYDYDAAGNRTLMSDSAGNVVTYAYNALSQLQSEARQFAGLSGTYTLAYQYTLGGDVKSVTDQTAGTSFSYTPDHIGRLSSIDSTGLGASTPLVSNAQYRASGAPKHQDSGNGTGVDFSYNGRGLITHYSLSGVQAYNGASGADGSDYYYYADGRVKFASDLNGRSYYSMSAHDKSYQYDHVGRLQKAFTSVMANDVLNGTTTQWAASGPYMQINSYDVWGNLVSREGLFWNEDSPVEVQTYDAYNRNTAWSYDADGRVLSMNEPPFNELTYVPPTHTFDAAGRHVKATQTTSQQEPNLPGHPTYTTVVTTDSVYDPAGQQVKRVKTTENVNHWTNTEVSYYLGSSVLGQVITEYNAQGGRAKSYVYGGATLITADSSNSLSWRYSNPVTGDARTTNTQGRVTVATYLDPQGINLTPTDPAASNGEPPPPQPLPGAGAYGTYLPHSLGGSGRCNLDGMEIGCGFANSLLAGGAAAQCPDNDCGPRSVTVNITYVNGQKYSYTGLTSPFVAYADNTSGFLFGGKLWQDGYNVKFTGPAAQAAADTYFAGEKDDFASAVLKSIAAGSLVERQLASGGAGGGKSTTLNKGPKAEFKYGKFLSCLKQYFPALTTFDDGRSRSLSFDRSHGGSFVGGKGGKTIMSRTEVNSYGSVALGQMLQTIGVGNGAPNSGATFNYYPQRNYVASDVAADSSYLDIGIFAIFIHETANSVGDQYGLADPYGGYAQQNAKLGIRDSDVGAAFETCVFGGLVGLQSGRVGNSREMK